jgi:hypothetical protein
MKAASVENPEFGLDRIRRQGDKIMVGVLWFLSLYSFAIAPWHNTGFEAAVIGLPAALLLGNENPGRAAKFHPAPQVKEPTIIVEAKPSGARPARHHGAVMRPEAALEEF